MPKFLVVERYNSFASVEIEADTYAEVERLIGVDEGLGNLAWEYNTDYDYCLERTIEKTSTMPPMSKQLSDG